MRPGRWHLAGRGRRCGLLTALAAGGWCGCRIPWSVAAAAGPVRDWPPRASVQWVWWAAVARVLWNVAAAGAVCASCWCHVWVAAPRQAASCWVALCLGMMPPHGSWVARPVVRNPIAWSGFVVAQGVWSRVTRGPVGWRYCVWYVHGAGHRTAEWCVGGFHSPYWCSRRIS